jgi:hypothetical protein
VRRQPRVRFPRLPADRRSDALKQAPAVPSDTPKHTSSSSTFTQIREAWQARFALRCQTRARLAQRHLAASTREGGGFASPRPVNLPIPAAGVRHSINLIDPFPAGPGTTACTDTRPCSPLPTRLIRSASSTTHYFSVRRVAWTRAFPHVAGPAHSSRRSAARARGKGFRLHALDDPPPSQPLRPVDPPPGAAAARRQTCRGGGEASCVDDDTAPAGGSTERTEPHLHGISAAVLPRRRPAFAPAIPADATRVKAVISRSKPSRASRA